LIAVKGVDVEVQMYAWLTCVLNLELSVRSLSLLIVLISLVDENFSNEIFPFIVE